MKKQLEKMKTGTTELTVYSPFAEAVYALRTFDPGQLTPEQRAVAFFFVDMLSDASKKAYDNLRKAVLAEVDEHGDLDDDKGNKTWYVGRTQVQKRVGRSRLPEKAKLWKLLERRKLVPEAAFRLMTCTACEGVGTVWELDEVALENSVARKKLTAASVEGLKTQTKATLRVTPAAEVAKLLVR